MPLRRIRPPHTRPALGLAVALVAALACAPTPPPAARNLVWISIDTLRPDHLGAYGHARDTSPALDALARRGVLFEDASSTAPWTLPAHASMLTGLTPTRHGVRTNLHRLPADVPTLPELLSARGFDTAAFVNAFFMEHRFGLSPGFETYQVFPEDQSRAGATRRVLEAAETWLDRRGEERFFLFVHLFDVHSHYQSQPRYEAMFAEPESESDYSGDTFEIMLGMNGNVPLTPDDAEHLARLYDAGIRQLDDELAGFLATLASRDDTLLIVTSDHGEEFLEHGSMVHGRTHYTEVLRVPLLLAGPSLPAGARIEAPVSLIDLAPTALDLLGMPGALEADGRSLRPLWEEGAEAPPPRALLAETGPMDEDALRSLRRGRWKLIVDRRSGERRLYDLAADPGEQRDLAGERPAVLASLAAELDRLTAHPRQPDELEPLTEEMKERLRSLGYLGPEAGESP